MLTNKGKYGLKALIHLAAIPPGEPTQVADIAARNNIPKKFLDAILLELRNAGLVRSRKGPGGGYTLAKPSVRLMGRWHRLPAPAARLSFPAIIALMSGRARCE